MTFEAGSSVLNINAVTARLIDRGRHFHLVKETAPSGSANLTDVCFSSSAVPSASFVEYNGSSNPPQQSDGVAFELRPPTVPQEECGELNEAVHLEWLKGRGAAWISGSPELQFSKEDGSFRIFINDSSTLPPDQPPTMITESGLAAALDTLEDAALENCVSRHLTEGGDDRLHLSSDGVNKYFCPPRPLSDEVVIRGSCTCSAPTPDGFEAARMLLRDLWSGRTSFGESMTDMRHRISRVLRLRTPHEVILHPSGSDAELIPLLFATIQAQKLGCSRIVNIVTAAGEVGSGTAPAAGGRHFSDFTPCGGLVKNGETLDEFPTSTSVIEIKPRDSEGRCIVNYDELIMKEIDQHENLGDKPFVVVHAVDGSKTGLRIPSHEILENIIEKYRERVLVVMDACQCRSEPEELQWFLERGSILLVTSSKFYSAPGFCGAVIVPMNISNILSTCQSPVGLKDYLTKYEVPPSIRDLHGSLPSRPRNVGLLLRWACGITEMELFSALGNSVKIAIRDWVQEVRKLVAQRRPLLDLIDMECWECEGDQTRVGGINSVISIKFLSKCGTKYIDTKTLRRVHKLLTVNASKLLPAHATAEERMKVSLKCMVGQPVDLGDYAILRLAIGAPMARDIIDRERFRATLINDGKILDKMVVLGKYCEEMMS